MTAQIDLKPEHRATGKAHCGSDPDAHMVQIRVLDAQIRHNLQQPGFSSKNTA